MLDVPHSNGRVKVPPYLLNTASMPRTVRQRVKYKAPISITPSALARSRYRRDRKSEEPYTPFAVNYKEQHPPSVGPGEADMAMDDDLVSTSVNWANNIVSSMVAEGQAFLGYPYLTELAQRVEYRKISETYATEMTRKFIKLRAKGDAEDKADKITKMNDEMARLKVKEVFREITELDGYFGRAHIQVDLGTNDNPDELLQPIGNGRDEISKKKVKKGSLQGFTVIEPVWCWPTRYNSADPTAKDFYKPTEWYCMSKPMHASRLITFVGRPVRDLLKPAYSFGGLSRSQMSKPYIDNWLRTRQSVSDLLHSFSISGIKTDLSSLLKDDGLELERRIEYYNNNRDNRGLAVLDKESEEFFLLTASLASLDKLQAQALEHICTSCGIPLVKYTGISPSGLNATSEWEIRVFYDLIKAEQEAFYTGHLRTMLGFIQLSLFGEVDEDIDFVFEPLYEMTELEKSQKRKLDTDNAVELIQAGVLHPEEDRKRVANDPDSLYEGLDINDTPDDPMEKQFEMQQEASKQQFGMQSKMADKQHGQAKEMKKVDQKGQQTLQGKKDGAPGNMSNGAAKGKGNSKSAASMGKAKGGINLQVEHGKKKVKMKLGADAAQAGLSLAPNSGLPLVPKKTKRKTRVKVAEDSAEGWDIPKELKGKLGLEKGA